MSSSPANASRPRKRDGFSPYNRIFEFSCQLRGENVQMVVTSVSGHLMGLDFAQSHRKWKSCLPGELFDAPIEKCVPEKMENIAKTLRREARECQVLMLWLDCDREGGGFISVSAPVFIELGSGSDLK